MDPLPWLYVFLQVKASWPPSVYSPARQHLSAANLSILGPLCLQMCLWASVPISGHLLRPLAAEGASFRETPLDSDAINKRLQHHLSRLGLFEGESTHGVRRGTLIHDYQELGKSAVDVGHRLQHAQPGGPQSMQYVDTSRETGGPSKQKRPRH